MLYSDSQYTLKGLKEWIPGWMRKSWRTSTGEPVKNKELWQLLKKEYDTRKVTLKWVRWHNGHPENEKADELAREGLLKGI